MLVWSGPEDFNGKRAGWEQRSKSGYAGTSRSATAGGASRRITATTSRSRWLFGRMPCQLLTIQPGRPVKSSRDSYGISAQILARNLDAVCLT